MSQKVDILMLGPSVDSLGGISRVVKIWQHSGIFEEHGIKYCPTTTDANLNKYIFFFKNFYLYCSKLFSRRKTIYVHTSSYKSFYRKSIFLLPAILLKHKILLHIHPSHFYDFISHLDGCSSVFVNFILSQVYGFVFLTEEMQKKFSCLFPKKPMWVLRNPVDMAAMINKKGYVRKDDELLYMGWFIREKGVFELVDAVEILRERGYRIKLSFCGTKKIDRLIDYIRKKQLDSVIKVLGWIEGEDKLKKLYESTLLILPSHSEGIPNVILEAMATKTPIIATLVGGLKEVLIDGKNAIIVRPNNAHELAEKIALCLDNKGLREKIAANAFYDAKNKYDVSIIKGNLARILHELATVD